MLNGITLSSQALIAENARTDVNAHNLANTSTVGFKTELLVFQERFVERVEPDYPGAHLGEKLRYRNRLMEMLGGGPHIARGYISWAQGDLEATGREWDVAIEGEGLFQVLGKEHTDGVEEMFFTRAGNFVRNANGALTTQDGQYQVLDADGNPVVIPATVADSQIVIAEDGRITANGAEIGSLGIARFDETTRNRFERVQGNLFRLHSEQNPNVSERLPHDAQALAAQEIKVRGGYLEQSGHNPIQGLRNMIEGSKAYGFHMRMLNMQDQTLGQAINTVGRVPV